MQDLERECLNKINMQLTFFYRYNIILAAPSDKIDLILEIFNNYHETLKFTMECEVNVL